MAEGRQRGHVDHGAQLGPPALGDRRPSSVLAAFTSRGRPASFTNCRPCWYLSNGPISATSPAMVIHPIPGSVARYVASSNASRKVWSSPAGLRELVPDEVDALHQPGHFPHGGLMPMGRRHRPRKVRLMGRGPVGAGRVSQVISGHAACATVPRSHVRWLGELPPRRSDRVSPGGESGPPGAPGPSAASPDRCPTPSTRRARPATRTARRDAGRRHRHA